MPFLQRFPHKWFLCYRELPFPLQLLPQSATQGGEFSPSGPEMAATLCYSSQKWQCRATWINKWLIFSRHLSIPRNSFPLCHEMQSMWPGTGTRDGNAPVDGNWDGERLSGGNLTTFLWHELVWVPGGNQAGGRAFTGPAGKCFVTHAPFLKSNLKSIREWL